jgi:general secretion pathway protein G
MTWLLGLLLVTLAGWFLLSIFMGPPEGPRGLRQNETDLEQLSHAVDGFVDDFKTGSKGYFPSRLKLCEQYTSYDLTQKLDQDSVRYLNRMFPRLDHATWTKGIDWNGNGKIDAPEAGGVVVLEGDQCLVFFLGGIPGTLGDSPGVLGFSTNGADPATFGGARKGPYYEFNTGRLYQRNRNGFYSYYDAYHKQPYAYFSSYSRRNGYNRYGTSDCASLGVWPYADTLTVDARGSIASIRYLKPDSFQIISAGEDGKFGPGTDLSLLPRTQPFLWTPDTAPMIPEPGKDDQSNFHSNLLGKP